jgi:hypothetical protein
LSGQSGCTCDSRFSASALLATSWTMLCTQQTTKSAWARGLQSGHHAMAWTNGPTLQIPCRAPSSVATFAQIARSQGVDSARRHAVCSHTVCGSRPAIPGQIGSKGPPFVALAHHRSVGALASKRNQRSRRRRRCQSTTMTSCALRLVSWRQAWSPPGFSFAHCRKSQNSHHSAQAAHLTVRLSTAYYTSVHRKPPLNRSVEVRLPSPGFAHGLHCTFARRRTTAESR